MPTDWVLAVVMEAYWAYTLYAWLAASPGPRSRTFAMWSCGVVFILSLVGQVTYHEMTLPQGTGDGARASAAFVTILPVTVLAMIAVLIHLRHADREAKAHAVRVAVAKAARLAEDQAAADGRTALRAELAEARAELDAAFAARTEAEQRAAQAETQAASFARKLAANAGVKKDANAGRGKGRNAAETPAPNDISARAAVHEKAKRLHAANPSISGAELGKACGMGERWGQMRKAEFDRAAPQQAAADGNA